MAQKQGLIDWTKSLKEWDQVTSKLSVFDIGSDESSRIYTYQPESVSRLYEPSPARVPSPRKHTYLVQTERLEYIAHLSFLLIELLTSFAPYLNESPGHLVMYCELTA